MPPLREPSARSPCAGCVTIWVDAQLSPALARWLSQQFSLVALSVQELGFRSAIDPETFFAAREANAIGSRKLHKVLHLPQPSGAASWRGGVWRRRVCSGSARRPLDCAAEHRSVMRTKPNCAMAMSD